jgi:hypothetical protein
LILGGLDDDELVVELICGDWSWRHVAILFHILLASWSLLSLMVGFLKPLLVGTKRHKLGLVKELVLWYQLVLRKSAKIGSSTSLLYLMVFINDYILLSFPFISGVSCLHD